MINEEDHLRLQAISAGKALRECCEAATEWMRHGEEKLSFAFRQGLGYLTACPSNLGAAMRLSVMIHLPALHQSGAMPALIRSLNDSGFAVRGLFGEHSREGGSIYQISNQNWREKTPEEILYHFEKALEQVEAAEWKAGQALLNRDRLSAEDAVSRALGLLKYAKKMSYGEFITHYSTLRFGRVLGLEEAGEAGDLDRLFIELMPAPLELGNRALSDSALRDRERARRLREHFSR
jgi:protein arginine kinase